MDSRSLRQRLVRPLSQRGLALGCVPPFCLDPLVMMIGLCCERLLTNEPCPVFLGWLGLHEAGSYETERQWPRME